MDDWDDVRQGLHHEHLAIDAAVRVRNPDAAAALVERHIRGFATRLLSDHFSAPRRSRPPTTRT